MNELNIYSTSCIQVRNPFPDKANPIPILEYSQLTLK